MIRETLGVAWRSTTTRHISLYLSFIFFFTAFVIGTTSKFTVFVLFFTHSSRSVLTVCPWYYLATARFLCAQHIFAGQVANLFNPECPRTTYWKTAWNVYGARKLYSCGSQHDISVLYGFLQHRFYVQQSLSNSLTCMRELENRDGFFGINYSSCMGAASVTDEVTLPHTDMYK